MSTYKEAFVDLINLFKRDELLDYEFFDFSKKVFEENAQSRICHFSLKNECDYNQDAIVMVFTIGNNVGRTVIQSEGAKTSNPSSTYPQKTEAIRLAKENKWKYIALAISSDDFDNETIREYVVSIESTEYAKATVCVLDDCIEELEQNGCPDFYRCIQNVKGIDYSLAFIKKDKLIDYISLYDNRPEVERAGDSNDISDVFKHNLYGMHIKKHNNALSIEDPHICIGWSMMGDLSDCNDKESISVKHEETWPDAKPKSRGQDVGQIYRFVVEAQKGDYVVFGDGSIAHVGVIESEYYYHENPEGQDNDYVNNRSVKWLKDVSYSDLSLQFKNSLGSAMSFFRLNDYKSVVHDLLNGTYEIDDIDDTISVDDDFSIFDFSKYDGNGVNKIFYGTPGCGKSYHIEHDILGKDQSGNYTGEYDKDNIIRTTFYMDYTNTDFVGQILPKVTDKKVEYIFNPGPFTLALIQAIKNPEKKVALIIEEINRGNAPAIFGDIFQLLDRDDNSISEYGIKNVGIIDYLNAYNFGDEYNEIRYSFDEIKIPRNLYIYATMNTSDQNVFTLDTAFTRRWEKKRMSNEFTDECEFRDYRIPGMEAYSWQTFVEAINTQIKKHIDDLQVNEDKQIGVYFVNKHLLVESGIAEKEIKEAFAYKVLEYLWNDVSKLDHEIIFRSFNTFEDVVKAYNKKGADVFNPNIFKAVEINIEESKEDDE